MDSLNELKEKYTNLVNDIDFDLLELSLQQPNVFEIIGVVNKEIKHSNFLGWLCDPLASHGLNEIFLKRFLREIFASDQFNKYDSLDAEMLDYSNVEIRREWRNIDLLMLIPHRKKEKSTVVCIENKIWSKEHSNQLDRYKKIVEDEFSSDFKQQVFVYLNPYGYSPNDKKSEYIPIGYSIIIDILKRINQVFDERLNNHSQLLINDYVKILNRYMMQESDEIKYAQKIYKEHKKILDFIYENKPDIQLSTQDWISNNLKEKGYILGSKNRRFVRFLPREINDLVPRYKEKRGGWSKKEAFLFEIILPQGQNRIVFQAAIAPGDQKTRELLYGLLKDDKASDVIKVKDWLVLSYLKEKVDWDKAEMEGLDYVIECFEKLLKKAQPYIERTIKNILECENEILSH
jgi:hypothetical protein